MNESTAIALVDQLKKLNENIEEHNNILISHFASLGEVEFIDFPEMDLDS